MTNPTPEDVKPAMPPRPFRILVVEDDTDLCEIITEFLKDELNVDVRMESNGYSAALQIGSWHPDLILLDFMLPGMNGFEICKKIRENPNTCKIPIIAVTALASLGSKKAILEIGVTDIVNKPFFSEELLQKIRNIMGIWAKSPSAVNPAGL